MKTKIYVVYKLYFENSDKFYIGKTCNMKSRINAHKKEALARKYRTYKINWLRKHLLNDEELKSEILFRTNDEREAYDVEQKFIIKTSNDNVNCSYNLQYPSNKSEAGLLRMAEIFGKDYIIINKQGTFLYVHSLSRFSRENNLNYKDLNACARKKINSSQGYKVFYKDDWDDFSEEEKQLEIEKHKKYNQYKTEKFKCSGDKYRKEYIIIEPTGNVTEIVGLSRYVKDNKLNDGNMTSALTNNKLYKGYQVFYKSEWYEFDQDTRTKLISNSKNYLPRGSKRYKITDPNDNIEIIVGLSNYANKHKLHAPSLSSLATGKLNKYKGYKVEVLE